jgi:GNAT superfamily N-acetyltransferase
MHAACRRIDELEATMVTVEMPPGAGALEALLPADLPTRPRALAVLDGVLAGRVWTDDPDAPSWVVVIETADGTVYVGGFIGSSALLTILGTVETRSGDLVFGFAGPDDPVRRLVPPDPPYVGRAVDFTDRHPPDDEGPLMEAPIRDGLRLAHLDADLLPQTEWYVDTLHAFGSVEGWTANGVGRCVLDGSTVVAESMAGPRSRGLLEMGVATRGPYRRRGLGALVSRHVARACEAAGDRVWWNTSESNLPSQRIARALGFRTERWYDLVAYRTAELPL